MKSKQVKPFGELTELVTNLWTRPLSIVIFGRNHDVSLSVVIYEDEGLSESQPKAFHQFELGGTPLCDEVACRLLEYYQSVCDQYRDQMDVTDPKDPNVPLIDSVDELAALVTPEAVYFPGIYDEPTFGFMFKCTWEVEHGVAVVVKNGKVKEVGYQDIIL